MRFLSYNRWYGESASSESPNGVTLDRYRPNVKSTKLDMPSIDLVEIDKIWPYCITVAFIVLVIGLFKCGASTITRFE